MIVQKYKIYDVGHEAYIEKIADYEYVLNYPAIGYTRVFPYFYDAEKHLHGRFACQVAY